MNDSIVGNEQLLTPIFVYNNTPEGIIKGRGVNPLPFVPKRLADCRKQSKYFYLRPASPSFSLATASMSLMRFS